MKNNIWIINADDFGYDSNVNAAILRCFKEGLISSATIMANMQGFDEACQMIDEYNLYEHVGIHFVLSDGVPLTDKIKMQRRFCNTDGIFIDRNTSERLLFLTNAEKEAVKIELREQINRCRMNGLKLTHCDSHHHIHEEIGILLQIIPLMRDYNIPHLRIMGNQFYTCRLPRRIYSIVYNGFLSLLRLNRAYVFESLDCYLLHSKATFLKKNGQVFEIMVHPTLESDNVIRENSNKKLIGSLIDDVGLRYNTESYSGAKYLPSCCFK